nr:MAG TPA: hypothetical protein [Bacteriophage sp.]
MIPLQFALRRRMMMANNNKVTFSYTGNCDIPVRYDTLAVCLTAQDDDGKQQ